MLTIPPSLWRDEILQYLDPTDRRTCRLVSVSWNRYWLDTCRAVKLVLRTGRGTPEILCRFKKLHAIHVHSTGQLEARWLTSETFRRLTIDVELDCDQGPKGTDLTEHLQALGAALPHVECLSVCSGNPKRP
jgi:hypothetical protein